MPQEFRYLTCCVQAKGEDITAMVEQARPITLRVFAKHCDWRPLARTLGYQLGRGRGLQLRQDWHVRYYRSVYQGAPCYFLKHSAIEYIFTRQDKP